MRSKLRLALLLGGLLFPAASIFGFTEPVQTASTSQTRVYTLSGGRSYMGVDIEDITSDRVGPLKLREERGVEVTMVDQDAPAGKAGVKEHDVILEFNGSKVESGEQLRRFIRETPPGRTVTLGISRDGSSMNIKVELVDRGKVKAESMPRIRVQPIPPIPPMPRVNIPPIDFQWNMYSPYLGVQFESIGRQLGEYFGIKNGEGFLIKSVEKNSPAEKAGLKAGDVIVRADNERVSDRSDLRRILANHRKGGKVAIAVMRDRKEQTITVDIPEHQSKESSGI